MKYLFINAVCGIGSTGKICAALAQECETQGHIAKIAYGRNGFVPEQFRKYAVRIGSDLDVKVHGIYTRITDKHGFGSVAATKKFLYWAQKYDPDVLWLHNIHGYYINIDLLFQWIKSRPNMQVKWTLHDCWAFTGHCTYFDFVRCDRWKSGCHSCPQKNTYPASMVFDCSRSNYLKKQAMFTGVPNMQLITPSKWLANLVKQSFLKEYPVEVIYNTVNTDIFKPTPGDFREKYSLEEKKILLGVANVWEPRKGLDDFAKLASMLDDNYRIVLVGLKPEQIKQMPDKVIGIEKTHNQQELAEIYTTADLLVNPSREETFGMTILEAHCCGTESVVYQGTACEEVVNEYGGMAVPIGVDNLLSAIRLMLPE